MLNATILTVLLPNILFYIYIYINKIKLTTPTVCSDNNKKLIQMIQDCHTITRQHLLHMASSSGGRRNYNKSKRLWQKYKFNVERSSGWLNGSMQHCFFWGAIYFRPLTLKYKSRRRCLGLGCYPCVSVLLPFFNKFF